MALIHHYAQLNAQGIVEAISQVHSPIEASHMVPIQSMDAGLIGMRYVATTHTFEAAPQIAVPELRRVSVLGFRRRFTPAERAAIEWAAVDRADQPDARRQQAAALRATLADQAAARFIDLDDPATAQGVQGLEALTILAPGRAAEILNTPVQPEELP